MIKKTVIQKACDGDGIGFFQETSLVRLNNKQLATVCDFLEEYRIPYTAYLNAEHALTDEVAENMLSTKMENVYDRKASEEEHLLADELIMEQRHHVAASLREAITAVLDGATPLFNDVTEKHVFQKMSAEDAHMIGFDKSNEVWGKCKDQAIADEIETKKDCTGEPRLKEIFRMNPGFKHPSVAEFKHLLHGETRETIIV